MEAVHTERDAETGVSLKIMIDPDSSDMSPVDAGNDEAALDIRFVVLHGRYSNPAEDYGLTSVEAVEDFEAEAGADWFIVPLWLYDHSGTVYRVGAVNPFSCRWDSGRVGIVAVKRGAWGDNSDAGLLKIAESYAEEYTAWANGDVYGYGVEDADGEVLDSCWGFIGFDCAKGEALSAFRACVETERESQAENRARELADDCAALEASRADLYQPNA